MRTVITGGTLVTADGASPMEVLVQDEKVVALAAGFTGLSEAWQENADLVVDASGKYVLPGGIDAHTHMDMPFGGTTSADTFETGTRAAAWGGTTMIIDFAIQTKGGSVLAGMDTWRAKANGAVRRRLLLPCHRLGRHRGFAEGDGRARRARGDELQALHGLPGVFYSTDKDILRAMDRAAGNGALIMMHAENGIAIDAIVAAAIGRGQTDPIYHGLTRPAEMEGEATSRAVRLAQVTRAPLYIVHVSSEPALEAIVEARDRGQNVFAETCPQYLFLSEEDMARPDFEGAKFVCTPPLRPREHQSALWRGLRTDDLSVVATDHCPFCFAEQKQLGVGDFTKIPNGLPGVENRMDLIFQGVVSGEISLARWVEVTSTNPAKMFGLFPRKGTIAPGSDADIVIYDPAAEQTISAATHHMAVDYSCYEGMRIKGHVDAVFSRGRQIICAGSYMGEAGHGRFVPRQLSQHLR